MAEYEVSAGNQPFEIGATGAAEILQNVRTVISTAEFSVPMDRGFAWSPDVDAPVQIAQAKLASKLAAAIRKYEPRAQFVSVRFSGDVNGLLNPIVKIKIVGGIVTT